MTTTPNPLAVPFCPHPILKRRLSSSSSSPTARNVRPRTSSVSPSCSPSPEEDVLLEYGSIPLEHESVASNIDSASSVSISTHSSSSVSSGSEVDSDSEHNLDAEDDSGSDDDDDGDDEAAFPIHSYITASTTTIDSLAPVCSLPQSVQLFETFRTLTILTRSHTGPSKPPRPPNIIPPTIARSK